MPPSGADWIKMEAAIVGLRFRRSTSGVAAAITAAASTVPSINEAAAATLLNPTRATSIGHSMHGPQYRLAPESTNPRDANAVQVNLPSEGNLLLAPVDT